MSELNNCCGTTCDKQKLEAEMQKQKETITLFADKCLKQDEEIGLLTAKNRSLEQQASCFSEVFAMLRELVPEFHKLGETGREHCLQSIKKLNDENNFLKSKVKHLAEKEAKLLAIQQAYTELSECSHKLDKIKLQALLDTVLSSFKEVVS